MKDNPYILIGGLVTALLIVIGVAWYVGSSSPRGPISKTQATKTFRAEAGTQRDNAKALISDREHDQDKEGTRAEPVEVWGRFDSSEQSESKGDPWKRSQRLAEDVLRDLDPEQGIAVLTVELQKSEAPSELYAAMATLYSRMSPYDEAAVEDAFALALSTAANAEERLDAVYRQAKVYMERGETAKMLELFERTRPETAEYGKRSAEIEIMRANGLMVEGNAPGAVTALEGVVFGEESEPLLEDESYEAVYRQAAVRLMRFYKDTGNDAKAETLARTLRSQARN